MDFLDNFIFVDANQKAKLWRTIETFIQLFPDLNKFINGKENKSVFDIEKQLEVPYHLSNFFNIIRKSFKTKRIGAIFDKVYDYVMSKLN